MKKFEISSNYEVFKQKTQTFNKFLIILINHQDSHSYSHNLLKNLTR